jgi:hypothetical protein
MIYFKSVVWCWNFYLRGRGGDDFLHFTVNMLYLTSLRW